MSVDALATAERRLRDYGGYLDLYPARALWGESPVVPAQVGDAK